MTRKKNQDWPCKAERDVTNIMFNELMTLLQGQVFQVAQKLHPSHLLGKRYADQLRFHPENRQCFLLENLSSHRRSVYSFLPGGPRRFVQHLLKFVKRSQVEKDHI